MKNIKSLIKNYRKIVTKNKWSVVAFLSIVALFVFLRFYQIEERGQFHIDQVNDALKETRETIFPLADALKVLDDDLNSYIGSA